MTKGVIFEIHDFSPAFRKETEKLFGFLEGLGLKRPTLLVIPNYSSKYPLNEYPDLLCAIKEMDAEIILHGYSHTGPKRLRHILLTSGEAEFFGLSREETFERINRGKAMLEEVGFHVKFFVPPAWFFNPYIDEALKAYGFKGVSGRLKVRFFEVSREIFTPVLSLSTRRFLAEGSLALLFILKFLILPLPLIRLAVHMREFNYPKRIKLWRNICAALKNKRRFMTYEALLCQS